MGLLTELFVAPPEVGRTIDPWLDTGEIGPATVAGLAVFVTELAALVHAAVAMRRRVYVWGSL